MRQQYSATALIFAGSMQFTCRIINIGSSGVLLYTPEEVPRGTFLRINLTLPGIDQVLDVDGVVSRVGKKREHIIIGVKFFEPNAAFTATVAAFVEWLEEKRVETAGEELTPTPVMDPTPAPAEIPTGTWHVAVVPTTRAEENLARRTTGPHYPRVTTAELEAVSNPDATPPSRTPQEIARLKAMAEERWKQWEEETQARKELNEKYRQALRELEEDPSVSGK